MTSPAFWTQSVSAVFYPAVFLHNLRALNSTARYEKNEQVHQVDCFKRQTLTFIFQQIPYPLSIYPIYQINTREWNAASLHRSSLVKTAQRPGHFFSATISRLWANFLHQTCIVGLVKQLSQYTGWVNCIDGDAKSFRPETTNDRTPFLARYFQR